jgi:crotonobetainyl-CoA:carnitine CoA-transferase CaiB-like acyl-CoA transferase
VRVLELASESAALAGKVLADLGADVVVVEPPTGHASRAFTPFAGDIPGPDRSLWWWYYNTGKRGVTLDLAEPADAGRFRRLVEMSDVVVEAEPPDRLSALGLDFEMMASTLPALVWATVTPFGRRSVRAVEPATDLTIAASAGPAWSCGYDDHSLPPVRPGGNQAYHTASLWAVMGLLTALFSARRTGLGQHVDVSMHAASNVTTEAATYEWLVAGATVQRQTFRHAAVRPTLPRLLPTADGGHAIAAPPRRPTEFRAIVEWLRELGIAGQIDEFFLLEMAIERGGLGLQELENDPEAAAMYQAGIDAVRSLAAALPAREFFLGAQRRGVAAGMVMAPEEIMSDDHFRARLFPVSLYHDDLGRSVLYPGAPFQATATPWRVAHRAPRVGEHNRDILEAL